LKFSKPAIIRGLSFGDNGPVEIIKTPPDRYILQVAGYSPGRPALANGLFQHAYPVAVGDFLD
jgi:hypothetical protein